MTACPYCQEPVEGSALFCRSCGASLRLPEYDRAFCPHCGARVSSRQEFCHECHWSLAKPGAREPAPGPEPPPYIPVKPPAWKNPAVWGPLVGIGLIIALLPWLFISRTTTPPAPAPPAPKILQEKALSSAPVPAIPGSHAGEGGVATAETPLSNVALKQQLAELLSQLRDAHLKKDISLYSQAFSPDFPDLDKRRQKTLAVWDAYDYSSLDFELAEVKLLDPGHAVAQAIWNLNIRQKTAPAGKAESQVYKVWFSKDAGRWRISNLEMVRKTG